MVGRRKRRPALAATAIVVTLACVAWGGFSARSAGWFDRKPDWLLRWELGLDSRRPAALDELADRIENNARLSQFGIARSQDVAPPADSAARRLADAAANAVDFDDDCRDFLRSVWYYMSPPARRDVAAALLPLLNADDPAVALRAARVCCSATTWVVTRNPPRTSAPHSPRQRRCSSIEGDDADGPVVAEW